MCQLNSLMLPWLKKKKICVREGKEKKSVISVVCFALSGGSPTPKDCTVTDSCRLSNSPVAQRLMTHKAWLPPHLDKWQMSAAYSPGRHNFIKCKYHWDPLETLKGYTNGCITFRSVCWDCAATRLPWVDGHGQSSMRGDALTKCNKAELRLRSCLFKSLGQ